MGNATSKKDPEKNVEKPDVELKDFPKDLIGIIENGENGTNNKNGNYTLVLDALKNPNIDSKTKNEALKLAVSKNYTDVVAVLLEKGADPNTRKNGEPLLIIATKYGNTDIVELLISKRVNIDDVDRDDNTALLMAIRRDNLDIVKILLEKGANVNAQNTNKEIPIIIALKSINSRESPKIITVLINNGANVNYVSRDERKTPLHLASKIWYLADVVDALLEHGADVNAQTVNEETPLYLASQVGNIDIVKILVNTSERINKPARINLANNRQVTPIIIAYKNSNYEVANFLLQNGAIVQPNIEEKIKENIQKKKDKEEEEKIIRGLPHSDKRYGEGGRKTRKKYNKRRNVIKSKNKYSKKYHN